MDPVRNGGKERRKKGEKKKKRRMFTKENPNYLGSSKNLKEAVESGLERRSNM